MDVRHYFEPVDFSKFSVSGPLSWSNTIGAGIEKTMSRYNTEKTYPIDIAILGIPFDSRSENNHSNAPDKIREELYQLSKINSTLRIADFGNLKTSEIANENYQAIRDLTEYFNELKITTIILGGSHDLTIGICKIFQNDPFFSLSVVDSQLDIKSGKEPLTSKNFLTSVFRVNPGMFQFNLIAYQSYFVPPGYLAKTKGINNHLRLGLLRDNIKSVEPVFRNSDVVSFDMNSVKHADIFSKGILNPNGLRSEEACQLSRYAGIANRVKVFGLFDIDHNKDLHPSSIQLAAQMIWYFIEGFNNRLSENIQSIENKVYKVEVENVDQPIVFICDHNTGQWWMEINTINNEKRYFACSIEEYNQASNNEIPELWLKYVQKTDEILK